MSEKMLEKLPVAVRMAEETDTPQVMELTRTIWGGHDYVPYVWEEWLHDGKGPLVVAEHEGRLAGLAKLSRSSPENWWLRGLRTHPELEGRGVAAQIHHFLMDWWGENGSGTLRLATHVKRIPVHRLCEQTGFTRVGEFHAILAPAAVDRPTDWPVWRSISAQEAPAALEMLRSSPALALSAGMMDCGWEWVSPQISFIEEAAKRGMAWMHAVSKNLIIAWPDDNFNEETGETQTWLMLGAAACPVDELADLMLGLRHLAGEMGYTHAGWSAPKTPQIEPVLAESDYSWLHEDSVYVYAKEFAI